jgi:hypothetical protein
MNGQPVGECPGGGEQPNSEELVLVNRGEICQTDEGCGYEVRGETLVHFVSGSLDEFALFGFGISFLEAKEDKGMGENFQDLGLSANKSVPILVTSPIDDRQTTPGANLMGFLNQINATLLIYTKAHLTTVSMVLTTALLVLYGDNINRAVKNRIRSQHFIVRTLVFMLLCSVGYGLLATLIAPSIGRLLTLGGDRLVVPLALAAICFVGFLADQKRYM